MASTSDTAAANANAPWELLYWGHGSFGGRGEYIRLLFIDAGVEWVEWCKEKGADSIVGFCYRGENPDFPVFAPPILKRGNFVLNNTSSILRHLARVLNDGQYQPRDECDVAHADAIAEGVTDFIAAARLAFHPLNPTGSYASQKEEAKPYIKRFEDERIPKFFRVFESALRYNRDKQQEQAELYCVGRTCTYVDVYLYHALTAAKSQFPAAYARVTAGVAAVAAADGVEAVAAVPGTPLVLAFRAMMEARPRIAAYVASPDRSPFAGDSMM